jgi:hypothetical protein
LAQLSTDVFLVFHVEQTEIVESGVVAAVSV